MTCEQRDAILRDIRALKRRIESVVPDDVFEPLKAAIGDTALLELTYITALYFKHAVMSKALRTEYDDVEERIREIVVEGAEQEILSIQGE